MISDFWKRSHLLLEKFYLYGVLLFVSYAAADLSILVLRPLFLPEEIPNVAKRKKIKESYKSHSYYASILKRNIFNAKGAIPPSLSSKENIEPDSTSVVASKLPLRLLGTIVHINEKRSVVTLQLKNERKTESAQIGERIKDIIEVLKIERRKVFFRNLKNGRTEYLEIPDNLDVRVIKSRFAKSKQATDSNKDTFSFSMSRSVIQSYMDKLPELLRQAQVVAVRNKDGEVNGFKFAWIKKGSVFDKQLRFKKGDIIKDVNGEVVESASQGLRLYNALKDSDRVVIGVMRNGKRRIFDYKVE